jgi:uncharacterized protein (TIGR00369 family)
MDELNVYKHIIEEFIPFHKLLGIKLLDMKSGYASFLIPFRGELVGDPRSKRIHGGVISTALDAAGGAAAITTLKSDKDQLATIDIRVDYLFPGKPEDIIAEGKIVKDGASVIFTSMKAHNKGSRELIAEARAIYRVTRHEQSKTG